MSDFKTLGLGDSGPEVRSLHDLLRNLGYYIPDAEYSSMSFGQKTEAAIKKIQALYMITPANGKVDERTQKLIMEITNTPQEPKPEPTPKPNATDEKTTTTDEKKTFSILVCDKNSKSLPGAEVSVDGVCKGVTDARGEVHANIAFGKHTVSAKASCGESCKEYDFNSQIENVMLIIDSCSVEEATPEDTKFTIFGDVIRHDGGSIERLVVRAFDTDMGKERVIGGAFVNSNGTFSIKYNSKRFLRAEKERADLLIRIYSPQDEQVSIGESCIMSNAPENLKVTLIMLLVPNGRAVQTYWQPYSLPQESK